MKHYTAKYLLDPQHPVTIHLIGCGGTGSQVLNNLARMDFALRGLGHPGFMVIAWDPDHVSDSNIGRQLFSPAEIGMNKATLLITKINRFFGLEWQDSPKTFNPDEGANIAISCVDSAAARMAIEKIVFRENENWHPYSHSYYWLDFGNSKDTGQIVIGTTRPIEQSDGDCTDRKPCSLPTAIDLFGKDMEAQDTEEIQGPSCSLADALSKQDLFVNSALATLGCDLLWKMFRQGCIEYHGLFMNLKTMRTNPLPI